MNYVSVRSSSLRAVAYDSSSRTLCVQFTNGSEYEYSGVPASIHAALMSAASHGRYFAKHIKDVYAYQRIR